MVRTTKVSNRRKKGKKQPVTDATAVSSKPDREQLVKQLNDIGFKVPSTLSIRALRELVANNTRPVQKNVSTDHISVAHESQSSSHFPLFESASNQSGEGILQLLNNNDDKIKTPPRTYSLFTCPTIDSSDVSSMVEYVTPALRKAIQEGKDVSLVHLLMPPEHSASQYKDDHKEFTSLYLKSSDPRLHRPLSLSEFILAFIRYMNIMTEVHPERRAELTYYLSFVVKLAVQFPPPLFYEYHKNFSRKAASVLFAQNRRINWSVRDDELYFNIFAGRRSRTCEKCSAIDHSTDFCPSVFHADLKTNVFTASSQDLRSSIPFGSRVKRTPVFTADQREICFNFNGFRGCFNNSCSRAHVCLKCQQNHAQKDCRPSSLGASA